MVEFNRDKFAALVDSYAADLEHARPGEMYKWEAVLWFRQHWDPSASDFAEMLKISLEKTGNLLAGYQYLPRGMLLEFASHDPQGVRDSLLELLDGSNDFLARLVAFSDAMSLQLEALNELYVETGKKAIQNSYQDPRAMCVYLSLAHPEKYYLYKSEMMRKFSQRIDFTYPKGKFEKPLAFHELLDVLLEWVERNRPEVIEKSDSLMAPELLDADPAHHLFVQDIVFWAAERAEMADSACSEDATDATRDLSHGAHRCAPYSDTDFLSQVYLCAADLDKLKGLLKRKRNLILQGAPGTGKTFAAKRLAYAMMGCQDDSRIQRVQFHQGTTYDDFVYGYRPNDAGGFDPTPGVFVAFCRRAAAKPDEEFFFIIDEINRANISKVFGELLMLIEADHRGDAVALTVTGEPFAVPKNVYLIGMMNTADRGLALIDYALRRRFAFFEMSPALSHPRFLALVKKHGEKMERLVEAVARLNDDIEHDPALGRGFRIGHSYFCVGDDAPADVAASIAEYEIAPLIEEYWFDDDGKAEEERRRLEEAIK